MLNNTRRLTPEEIADRLPKILAAHSRKVKRTEERKDVREFQKKAANAKVGENLGEHFRDAYKNGTRFRSANGRFLGVMKVG